MSSVLNLADVVDPRVVIVGRRRSAPRRRTRSCSSRHGPALALPLRALTGFFLAGVYPPALKLMATWFRRGRGVALGILVGALTLGSATPHLVNGLGGLDWHAVIAVTSAAHARRRRCSCSRRCGRGPFPFPPRRLRPAARRDAVPANRGVRLASLGYFGHMWELYAMWSWFLVFAARRALRRRRRPRALRDVRRDRRRRDRLLGRRDAGRSLGPRADDRGDDGGLRSAARLTIGVVAGISTAAAVALALVWGFTVDRRLGAVLDARHRARGAGVRRHRARRCSSRSASR